jgi:hypothetical protein
MTRGWGFVLIGFVLSTAYADPSAQPPTAHPGPSGTIEETVCPLIESAAQLNHIPVAFLTRLIWTESRFRANVTSPKGAQGIAQFMPGTAAEQGLANPFDPEQAIPKAARLLVALTAQLGKPRCRLADRVGGAANRDAGLCGVADRGHGRGLETRSRARENCRRA